MGEPRTIPVNKSGGWTVDFKFLQAVSAGMTEYDECSLESIEAVILALEKLNCVTLASPSESK